jgi:DNA repair protein RecO (recombination protein O)
MQWTSESIIVKQQMFNDEQLICTMFSANYGIYKGLIKINKKHRGQIQVGNIVDATWSSRLAEHLGVYYLELIKPLPIAIIEDKIKLFSVASLCSMLCNCLPDKMSERKLYEQSVKYLLNLKDSPIWLLEYFKIELTLLQEMGYGLALDKCVLTGEREGLFYVSPKTGRAVTKAAGIAYHDKLLKLPGFLINKPEPIKQQDYIDAFDLLSHFFLKFILIDKELPYDRVRFVQLFRLD